MQVRLALMVACIMAFADSPAFSQPPQFILQWGTEGSGDGEFDLPRRLAVHASGTVYVSDRNNHRIQKFTSDGVFITKWGSLGTGDGQFDFPFGVAVDATNSFVYVAERNNNRIQKFTSDGTFLLKWGTPGTEGGQFNFPIAVDVGPDGNVYVGDAFNHRIQKFDANGSFIKMWGSQGPGNGQFLNPIGIAVDADGNVYVGDEGNDRVQKFSSGGAYLTQWGVNGTGDGEFNSPRGIGVGPDGTIYVADFGNSRVQAFTPNGDFVTKWGTFGSAPGQFIRLEDAEVDAMGNVYVADASNNRIQKFGPAEVPVTLSLVSVERDGQAAVIHWNIVSVLNREVAFHVYRGERPSLQRLTREPLRGAQRFEWRDDDAPPGRTSYWLEEISAGERYMHGPYELSSLPLSEAALYAPYPNPFNPSTKIQFSLPKSGRLRMSIVDARGVVVRNLIEETVARGDHTITWDARDSGGGPAPSGVYFARLEFDGRALTQKLVLIR